VTGEGIGAAAGAASVAGIEVEEGESRRPAGRPQPKSAAGVDAWARAAPRVAWGMWAIGLALRLVSVWILWRATEVVPVVFGIGMPTLLAACVMGFVTSTVGAVIVSRAPRNPIGWLPVFAGMAQGVLVVASWYAATAYTGDPTGPAAAVGSIAGSSLQALSLGVAALFILLFPDGRTVTRRWRWLVPVIAMGMALRFVDALLGPAQLYMLPTVPNPFMVDGAFGDALRASWDHGVGFIILFAALVLASVSIVIRSRRADAVLSRQIAWFAYAGVLVVVGSLPFAYAVLVVFPTTTEGAWAATLFFLVLGLPSVAAGVAILRYRLFEIDRIVNRTVLYLALSAVLAGVVAAAITLTQRAFVAATGERSDIAWVFTALIATATYTPVRKWLEGIVDRRLRYTPPFHAYRSELVEVLGVLAPERAARRLAEGSVAELGAIGAAVELDRGEGLEIVSRAGAWSNDDVAVRVPIVAAGRRVGAVLVRPRSDGRPHDPAGLQALAEATALAGEAMAPRLAGRAEPEG
jgi:hypothetical protein